MVDTRYTRYPAVAGQFYPGDPADLRRLVERMLAAASGEPHPVRAAMVPHAGLIYSGGCAAEVFKKIRLAPTIVILAPNHTGWADHGGGAGAWTRGSFVTPLGSFGIAEALLDRLMAECSLVGHDEAAHRREHAIEVELPFLALLSPASVIAPIVLAWDDWTRCHTLATALARVVRDEPGDVLLLASSDMTHYEPAESAARKDREALAQVEHLDGERLLETCRREQVTMCGRAPAAVVLDAARQLGATRAEIVDYRHSGWVTGDDSSVVAYAGVVIG